jgi:hypothetical protein
MARLYNLPYFGLKVVTDLMDLDRKPGDQLSENITVAASVLTKAAIRLLNDELVTRY